MDTAGKIAVGVTLGIGLVASTAAIYMLLSRDDEEELLKERLAISRKTESKVISIPRESIGAVIGRAGENIKNIERETRTRISFEECDRTAEVRLALIRGSPAGIDEAERYINEIIARQPVIFTADIEVPFAHVGTIIGRKGDTVRAMERESGAKIDIARIPLPNANGNNPISIRGTSEQILVAKELIEEKLAECDIKMRNQAQHRYKGRPLALEMNKDENWDDSNAINEPVVEELIATSDNGTVEVYVSAVETPDRFWVQIFGPKGAQLDRLSDKMTDFYEIEANQKKTSLAGMPIKIGDIVAAPYAMDENYYRVKILGINEDTYSPDDTQVRVFYLDFGDEGVHPKKALCTLDSLYLIDMPFQAIECRLNGVRPKGGGNDWSAEAIKYFTEESFAAQWKPVLCKPLKKVKSSSGNGASTKSIVMLVDLIKVINTERELNLAESLINRDFAQPANAASE